MTLLRVLARTPVENKINGQSILNMRLLQKLWMILLLLEISLELLEPPATVHYISKLPCDPDGEILRHMSRDTCRLHNE